MTVTYRNAPSLMGLPRWMQQFVSTRVLYTSGLILDALTSLAHTAVSIRFPSTAQPDALPYLGRDRNLDRGPNESDTSFVARLEEAFDTWATAGHPRELLGAVLAFLSPDAPIVRTVTDFSIWDTVVSGSWSRLYESSNWNWDGLSEWWRAWVIIYQPSFDANRNWGVGTWGDRSGTWGCTATATQVQALRNLVAKWKPTNIVVKNVLLSFDSSLFDPTKSFGDASLPPGNWGRPYKSSGGNAVPTRPTDGSVAFLDGAI